MSRRHPRALAFVVLPVLATLGCESTPPASEPRGNVTFNRDIAPVVWKHCGNCHRPGQIGPFSLLEYETARQHARQIAEAVNNRIMPPWLPEEGYGEFAGARRLATEELRLINAWVSGGAEEGDAADRREPPVLADGWQLGKPDLVVELPVPYTLSASGPDVFRNFVLPIEIPTTRYVRGMEVRPGSPSVVHHAAIVIDRTRASRKLDEADPQPGYEGMFAEGVTNPESRALGWTPGMMPVLEPPDMAWRLYRGSDLVVQLHMIPSGRSEAVRLSIGMYLSDVPPTRTSIDFRLGSKTIDIPAGKADYVVEDQYVMPVDADVVTIYPHAHYLAKDVRALAKFPDGTTKDLIWIKNWNFKWQDQYRYAQPVFLPAGTVLTMHYTYDNSAENPHNPSHPPRRVVYGPQSSDEMGDLWLRFVPRNAGDAATLARSYLSNELRKRIAMTEQQVRANPRDSKAHNELGALFLDAGRLDEGVRELREALQLQPGYAEAHNNLGTALQTAGRMDEALPHFREAARLAPNDDRVHLNFANALDGSGRGDEALRHYERAIALNGDSAEAHNNLGALLASRGLVDQAARHFQQALAIQPEYADALRNMSQVLQLTKDRPR
jgi:tetratricopeptide (TPR) repeat protein